MKRKFFDLRGLITACLMCFALAAAAQTTITGTVLDETGEPLIGATVQEKGNTMNGTATDLDGRFTLKVKSDKSTLLISTSAWTPWSSPSKGRPT